MQQRNFVGEQNAIPALFYRCLIVHLLRWTRQIVGIHQTMRRIAMRPLARLLQRRAQTVGREIASRSIAAAAAINHTNERTTINLRGQRRQHALPYHHMLLALVHQPQRPEVDGGGELGKSVGNIVKHNVR